MQGFKYFFLLNKINLLSPFLSMNFYKHPRKSEAKGSSGEERGEVAAVRCAHPLPSGSHSPYGCQFKSTKLSTYGPGKA